MQVPASLCGQLYKPMNMNSFNLVKKIQATFSENQRLQHITLYPGASHVNQQYDFFNSDIF